MLYHPQDTLFIVLRSQFSNPYLSIKQSFKSSRTLQALIENMLLNTCALLHVKIHPLLTFLALFVNFEFQDLKLNIVTFTIKGMNEE